MDKKKYWLKLVFVLFFILFICLIIANIIVERNISTYNDRIDTIGRQILLEYSNELKTNPENFKSTSVTLSENIIKNNPYIAYQKIISNKKEVLFSSFNKKYPIDQNRLKTASEDTIADGLFDEQLDSVNIKSFVRSIYIDDSFIGNIIVGFDQSEIQSLNTKLYIFILLFWLVIAVATLITFKKVQNINKTIVLRKNSKIPVSIHYNSKKIVHINQFTKNRQAKRPLDEQIGQILNKQRIAK